MLLISVKASLKSSNTSNNEIGRSVIKVRHVDSFTYKGLYPSFLCFQLDEVKLDLLIGWNTVTRRVVCSGGVLPAYIKQAYDH